MSRRDDLPAHAAALSRALGVEVRPTPILDEALTHPSASSRARPHNQRLEFLGDRVLGLVMAERLFELFPEADEGTLAPRFNALVRKETCAEVAVELGLGPMLRLGRSETMAGGRRKTAILGDAMEAVIAALHLDAGLETARAAILRAWGERPREAAGVPTDAKTALQEWAQARGMAPPTYPEIAREGPDHAPVFTVAARLGERAEARARAPSKRAAQQAAAAELLAKLEQDHDDG